MSLKVHALRGLVMERLAAAADEIFALFERTFAQYEEEVLRKLLQQPHVVLYKEDIQAVTVGEDQVIKEELIKIKQEVDPPSKLQDPSVTVKSEEPDPEKETRLNASGEQCDGEEPGCSTDLSLDNNRRPYSCSDTDDSDKWETTNSNGKEQNANLMKDATENGVICGNSLSSDTVMSNEYRAIIHRCSQCNMSFEKVSALEVHLRLHPGPFTCEICHKNISQKRAYQQHLRMHTQKKPYKCSVCKRSFKQSCHLKQHMFIHTGEKPFSCSYCGRGFRQQNSLMRHVLSRHSEYKPFKCSVCQKGFVQKYNFEVHLRKHTGKHRFRCSVCDKGIDSLSHFKRHLSRHKAAGEVMSEELQ
ncbi:hypothetical protein NQD34_000743 [Periophthalmus magnuspinnatus]|uniref:zinc finger protein 32-like n=1 Tax=Periophthalmus magnuspinnatus TaxID=409849 RepID=UPI0022C28796|nr:zinc finger protein 32-like [Periophthalmus magnuspinnatus]KAJ0033636.1 hypothetical protein NQD34_000743 [Periophthalmus magnuspinnatus]